MRARKLILVAGCQEDLDVLKYVYEAQGAVDITEAVPLLQYIEGKRHHPTRTAIGMKLEKRLPLQTHSVVSVLFPPKAGETHDDWVRRIWRDPVMSILSGGFKEAQTSADIALIKLNPST